MKAYFLPGSFPDHLAAADGSDNSRPSPGGDANDGPTVRRRYTTLLLLVLLCLVPRALMAWKIGGICPDAVVYIQVAESFDKGVLDQQHRFGLNLFPAILMLLHRLGLDWELAGKLWNVAISCLTVLPLYGWVRRQFDDRVALIAGCLYALHSELVRGSPEGIRDPTFWFFTVLSLYLLWRAISELRLPLFLGGGLAMALAAMTRSEGLFLLVPLVLWSIRRGNGAHRAERDAQASALRRRLLLGVMLAAGVLPALLVLAALFWFRGHAPWELIRTKPLDFIEEWMRGCLRWLSGRAATDIAAPGMRWTTMAGRFAAAMVKGMTPLFALFTCIGMAGWWRTWTRREHQAMFCTVLLFLLAIWIHMNVAHDTSARYFLPVVLIMSPFAALGLLACSGRLAGWAEGRGWGAKAGRVASWTPLLLFGGLALGNVAVCDYRDRAVEAELGRWANSEFGPSPALLGPAGTTQVVAYYARGRYALFDPKENDRAIEGMIRQGSFDMVLLPGAADALQGRPDLLRQAAGLGYGPIDDGRFPHKLRNMAVLVRRRSSLKN